MARRLRALVGALLISPLLGLAAEPTQDASVGTDGLTLKPITRGTQAGKKRAEQHFTFTLGESRYRIRYSVVVDPAKPGKGFPSEGYVGMPAPCSANWYHGGFVFVRINGRDIGGTMLHSGTVAETGRRAIADLVWDAKAARVRMRFAGLPGDDKLLCEIALEPKEPVKDLRISLRCYPSFFTAWHKRDGDRKIATPAATLNQGQRAELPAAKNWYAVYYDTVFDVAKGEGDGPCAAMFVPDAVRAVRFNVGGYAVGTDLICRPDARAIRLAFWDFRKRANQPVLDAFRRSADKWLKELRGFDFTPAAVRSFEPKAELAELDRLTRSPDVRKQLGKKAGAYRQRIAALTKPDAKLGILAQAELLGLLAAYREFLWELKVAALLAE